MPFSSDRLIDLNADVGEGPDEEPLYAIITSANIACGGHAGDEATMREAVRLALRHGVAIGAHPSYPDREGFGRVSRTLPSPELAAAIEEQVEALVAAAEAEGAVVTHVKPHGALYGDAAENPEVAEAIARGVAACSRGFVLVGLAGSAALRLWSERGFQVRAEGFADRRYQGDGTLVPRMTKGAVITDPEAAAAQAIRLATSSVCLTIGVHSDTKGAAAIAARVRRELERAGFVVCSLVGREGGT